MRQAEAGFRIRVRSRKHPPSSTLVITDSDGFEADVPVKVGDATARFHTIAVQPQLAYMGVEFDVGPAEAPLSVSSPDTYKLAFNLCDKPFRIRSGAGMPFSTTRPGDMIFYSRTAGAGAILPPGARLRGGTMLVGTKLMREVGEEAGLSENDLAPRPTSDPSEPRIRVAPAPRQIIQSLGGIQMSPLRGSLRRLYAEGKLLEILALMLWSTYGAADARNGAASIDPRARRRMLEAREVLTSRLSDLPSLSELARTVGVSTSTLKSGFRRAFGTSVYEYARAERLSLARATLLEGSRGVSEVAWAVGYRSLSHFSDAYRRQFGEPPHETRRSAHASP
jgi:AraC-like DNA-binding protein